MYEKLIYTLELGEDSSTWREGWWNIIYQGCLTECLYLRGRKQKTRFFQKGGGGGRCQKSKKNFRKQLGGVRFCYKMSFLKKTNQEQKLCNLILWWVVYYWPWSDSGRSEDIHLFAKGSKKTWARKDIYKGPHWRVLVKWKQSQGNNLQFCQYWVLFAYKDLEELKIYMGRWDETKNKERN